MSGERARASRGFGEARVSSGRPAEDPFDAAPYARVEAGLHLPSPGASSAAWHWAVAIAAAAWVPLLVLSAPQGFLAPIPGSFLLDVATHARYLVALPVMVGAAPWSLARLGVIARHFAHSGLVEGEDRLRLEALIASARRLLRHRLVVVGLAVGAYGGVVAGSGVLHPPAAAGWAATEVGGAAAALSPAGWWRALVSHPLFLIVLGLWAWRVLVWARFLWGVSRLSLRLVPAHPDLVGGLRFVAASLGAFAPIGLALGSVGAGTLAADTLLGESSPYAFGNLAAIAGALVIATGVFTLPLFCFSGPLRRARLRGLVDYGPLAGALGRRFEARWFAPDQAVEDDALAAPDFSATTDLYSIVANVHRMSLVPVGLKDLAPLVVATLLPFIPVALLVVPVDQMIGRVLGIFL